MPRIVVCVPAGRRRHLDILQRYLLREQDTFDHVDLWLNAWESVEDEAYVRELAAAHECFHLREEFACEASGGFTWYMEYYQACRDSDTIYVKMDDDIVWMESGAIEKLAAVRARDRAPLIVIGNIVNNGLLTPVHYGREMGMHVGDARYQLNVGGCAEGEHRAFLADEHPNLRFEDFVVADYRRAPNHVFAWFGDDPDLKMLGHGGDDEEALTSVVTEVVGRPVLYTSEAVFVHFAYTGQHAHMQNTDLLERYTERAEKDCPDTTPITLVD